MATRTPRRRDEPAQNSGGPQASRPQLPPDYGPSRDAKNLLRWSHVTSRVEVALHYWISTVGASGHPHATPVDGLWVDDALYFGGSPQTRWRRNLSANPRVCIHLESPTDVVILHGEAKAEHVDTALARQLSEKSRKKYGYGLAPHDYQKHDVMVFRPKTVFAWTNLAKDATRWIIE